MTGTNYEITKLHVVVANDSAAIGDHVKRNPGRAVRFVGGVADTVTRG